MTPEALADPIGVIVELVARRRAGNSDRAVIEEAVTSVAGAGPSGASSPRRSQQRPAVLIDGRSPGAPGGRGSADRAAQGGCRGRSRRRSAPNAARTCAPCSAAARTGTAASAARSASPAPRAARPRPGELRATGTGSHGARKCPPGGGRDPAEIVVESRRQPSTPRCPPSRDRRGDGGGCPGRAAPSARLGPARPARAAHRSGRPGTGPVRAAADRASSAMPAPAVSSGRRVPDAAGSSACTGGSAGSGRAATASPGPASSRAHGAGPSSRSLSVTSTAGRCARIA